MIMNVIYLKLIKFRHTMRRVALILDCHWLLEILAILEDLNNILNIKMIKILERSLFVNCYILFGNMSAN